MLDSPRHRRILFLLLLAFGLSAWFWTDPLLDWTRHYKDDIQTLAALIWQGLCIAGQNQGDCGCPALSPMNIW